MRPKLALPFIFNRGVTVHLFLKDTNPPSMDFQAAVTTTRPS